MIIIRIYASKNLRRIDGHLILIFNYPIYTVLIFINFNNVLFIILLFLLLLFLILISNENFSIHMWIDDRDAMPVNCFTTNNIIFLRFICELLRTNQGVLLEIFNIFQLCNSVSSVRLRLIDDDIWQYNKFILCTIF